MTTFGYNALTAATAPTGYNSWGHKCATVLIEYYRGLRSYDADPARRTTARPWLLGDIFHFVSGAGGATRGGGGVLPLLGSVHLVAVHLRRQDRRATPRAAYRDYVTSTTGPCGGGKSCEERKSVVLVGANDGFLHAFDAGDKLTGANPERDLFSGRLKYGDGTGNELWAFIPPDLLRQAEAPHERPPRLLRRRHADGPGHLGGRRQDRPGRRQEVRRRVPHGGHRRRTQRRPALLRARRHREHHQHDPNRSSCGCGPSRAIRSPPRSARAGRASSPSPRRSSRCSSTPAPPATPTGSTSSSAASTRAAATGRPRT